MHVDFNIEEILKTDLTPVEQFLFKKSDRDHREIDRIYEKHEKQYRMLKWLGDSFHQTHILDLGTRNGTSAFCLANSRENWVTTVDITHTYKGVDIRPFLEAADITFEEKDVKDLPDTFLLAASIISLDIGHDGYSEERFLRRLEKIGYHGLVIMDDVNFPRRFKKLNDVWLAIKQPKVLLPDEIAHDTGTGVVAFGSFTFSVTLPPKQP